ncbi:Uncharacterized protein DAT39_010386, partial [Clarias magur]
PQISASSVTETDLRVRVERVKLHIQQMLGSSITEMGHVSIPRMCCSDLRGSCKVFMGISGGKERAQ